MSYTAGNLELNLIGYNNSAITSIRDTAKALGSLSNAISKIHNTPFVFATQKLEYAFTKIASATNSINISNINALSQTAKSLGNISKIGNLEKVDFNKIANGFKTLETAITPFLNKVQQANTSLTALYGILSKAGGKQIQNLLNPTTTTPTGGGGLFGMFKISRIITTVYIVRRLANATAKMIQYGVDYTETLNLWTVAMRNNLGLAEEFVSKMNKAYGVSEQTLMNTQAIFKNMVGSLRQISDETAYQISESVTLLALDFASLYNTTVDQAMQKFQAMFAGQVRPIRSAGLDITETTLYQFYQEIGGTKTMRQLNRTEKQLLSILAVYKQMGTAGALGDMSKTLGNFANQSRMLAENFKTVATWFGTILEYTINEREWLVTINAHLIAIGEGLKAIAVGMGATKDENALTPLFETAETTNEEIDEMQGKLLNFDKFRALSGTTDQATAVDTKLLEALTGYSSVIDMANNKARQLAETWIENAGGVEAVAEKLEDLKDILAFLIMLPIAKSFTKIATSIITWVETNGLLVASIKALNTLLVTGIIFSIWKMIEAFKDGDYWSGVLYLAIGVSLVAAFVMLKLAMKKTSAYGISNLIPFFKSLYTSITRTTIGTYGLIASIGILTVGISVLVIGIASLANAWGQMGGWQKAITIFVSLAAAIASTAVALKLLKGNWAAALGVGAAVAGTGLLIGSQLGKLSVNKFAVGASDIDGGTLFVAGEMGKTEAVYTGSNGKANVANVTQMEQAFYNALVRYGKNGNGQVVVNLDGQKIYENTTAHARKEGRVWSKA